MGWQQHLLDFWFHSLKILTLDLEYLLKRGLGCVSFLFSWFRIQCLFTVCIWEGLVFKNGLWWHEYIIYFLILTYSCHYGTWKFDWSFMWRNSKWKVWQKNITDDRLCRVFDWNLDTLFSSQFLFDSVGKIHNWSFNGFSFSCCPNIFKWNKPATGKKDHWFFLFDELYFRICLVFYFG